MRSIEIVFCITVCLIGCATPKADEAKRNRERVNNLIQVGDQILEAQHILTEEGFTLVYEEPIHPTGPEDYLQQLVVIGDTRHSPAETFFYVTTGGAGPIKKESPYVIIEAQNDGIITVIK